MELYVSLFCIFEVCKCVIMLPQFKKQNRKKKNSVNFRLNLPSKLVQAPLNSIVYQISSPSSTKVVSEYKEGGRLTVFSRREEREPHTFCILIDYCWCLFRCDQSHHWASWPHQFAWSQCSHLWHSLFPISIHIHYTM